MASEKRLDNESYDDYHLRLRTNDKKLKKYFEGKVFWAGEQKTYIKKEKK